MSKEFDRRKFLKLAGALGLGATLGFPRKEAQADAPPPPTPSPPPPHYGATEIAYIPEDDLSPEQLKFEQTIQPVLDNLGEGAATLYFQNEQAIIYNSEELNHLYPEGAPNILLEDPRVIEYAKHITLQKAMTKHTGQTPALEAIAAHPEMYLAQVGHETLFFSQDTPRLGVAGGQSTTLNDLFNNSWYIVKVRHNFDSASSDDDASVGLREIDNHLTLFSYWPELDDREPLHETVDPQVKGTMYANLRGLLSVLYHDVGFEALNNEQVFYLVQDYLLTSS